MDCIFVTETSTTVFRLGLADPSKHKRKSVPSDQEKRRSNKMIQKWLV